ncbi:MAG: FAD-dependent monooxygenase [Verrucomicrobia bacterium]|nr:FAD-dependent monooxygenase [Verrucomicrobiota bacterium]
MSTPPTPTPKIEALVVGAGPTGLVLASELLKRGMETRLIDALAAPMPHSRALGIQPRTLEIFQQMGVLQEMLKYGLPVHATHFYKEGKRAATFHFNTLPTPHPYLLVLPQEDTERILTNHYIKLGGKLERGISFKSPTELLYDNGLIERVSPTWILGCDGAHSAVRHHLNLPFEGASFSEIFALADVAIQTALPPDEAHLFFHKERVCGMIPLPQKGWYRLVSLIGQKEPAGVDIALFQHILDTCSGRHMPITQASWLSLFKVQRRMTRTFRSGNTFLLGDAAHIHSPAGGQGLNTSVQDAFNLGWKLPICHHGRGTPLLLESYEKERLPVAKKVLKGTTAITYTLIARRLRSLIFPLLWRLPRFRKKLLLAMSELSVSYPGSPIVSQPLSALFWRGPRPGQRAPDAPIGAHHTLFEELAHPSHTLLCFGGPDAQAFLQEVDLHFRDLILIIHIEPGFPAPELHKQYAATQPCYYLIRPDGYIATRSRSFRFTPLQKFLKRIVK